MRLLRINRGVHDRVHRSDSQAVSGEMDLRVVRGGRQGRDREVREADQHRGRHDSAHEFLQEVQFGRAAGEPCSSSDYGDATDSQAKSGFSEVDAE